MGEYKAIPGWWEHDGHEMFARIVESAPSPAHFVEIGSWMGRSACSMAECLSRSQKVIRFDQVDTWQGSQYGSHPALVAKLASEGRDLRSEFENNLRTVGLWRFMNPVVGESSSIARGYENESLDCVFIDGDHRPEAVYLDVCSWWPKVKPGGTLCGHDWTNIGVRAGLAAFDLSPASRGMVWWLTRPNHEGPKFSSMRIEYPPMFPGVPRGWWYLLEGFRRLGCKITLSTPLLEEGYWSPPRKLGEPIHIAVIKVNGRRVYYDCSDFVDAYPEVGQPYFKKNCPNHLPRVLPIGQYLGTEPQFYLDALAQLRGLADEDAEFDTVACFSNIDERNNPPLRRELVTRLHGRPRVIAELYRHSKNRPKIPEKIAGAPLSPRSHWLRLAQCQVCLSTPGVAGDTTRQHVEILGIGRACLSVESSQLWPGNFRGCWATAKRTADDMILALDKLLADPAECQRFGRLGRWYFDTNLIPERMAERVLRECVKTGD